MKTTLAIVLCLLGAGSLRADTIQVATSPGMTIGNAPISLEFDIDTTTGMVIPGTTSISFLGTAFTLEVDDGTLIDWSDAAGDTLQLNALENAQVGPLVFPDVGDYAADYLDATCAHFPSPCSTATRSASYSHGEGGSLVVTSVSNPVNTPEPRTITLLGAGLLGLAILVHRKGIPA